MGVRDLADYPWDAVVPYRERAARHPDGLVDLSIGSPVDPTPEVIRRALAEATDAHAYPQTVGTADVRRATRNVADRARGFAAISCSSARTARARATKSATAGNAFSVAVGAARGAGRASGGTA